MVMTDLIRGDKHEEILSIYIWLTNPVLTIIHQESLSTLP